VRYRWTPTGPSPICWLEGTARAVPITSINGREDEIPTVGASAAAPGRRRSHTSTARAGRRQCELCAWLSLRFVRDFAAWSSPICIAGSVSMNTRQTKCPWSLAWSKNACVCRSARGPGPNGTACGPARFGQDARQAPSFRAGKDSADSEAVVNVNQGFSAVRCIGARC